MKNNQHAIECIERWIPQLEDMIELHVFGICTKTNCRKCCADRMLINMKELLNLCRAALTSRRGTDEVRRRIDDPEEIAAEQFNTNETKGKK